MVGQVGTAKTYAEAGPSPEEDYGISLVVLRRSDSLQLYETWSGDHGGGVLSTAGGNDGEACCYAAEND